MCLSLVCYFAGAICSNKIVIVPKWIILFSHTLDKVRGHNSMCMPFFGKIHILTTNAKNLQKWPQNSLSGFFVREFITLIGETFARETFANFVNGGPIRESLSR